MPLLAVLVEMEYIFNKVVSISLQSFASFIRLVIRGMIAYLQLSIIQLYMYNCVF